MSKSCTHKGITHVLTIGETQIHAGSEFQAEKGGDAFDLMISLTGKPNRQPMRFRMSKGSLRALPALNQYMKKRSHNLVIDWPDMQAPELDLAFWQALYADLHNLEGKAIIHCMGGHGRTGTALAILAYLSKASGDADPIEWVRKVYCAEAVETDSQIAYLKNVIGIPTKATKSRDYGTTWKPTDWTGKGKGGPQRLFPKYEPLKAEDWMTPTGTPLWEAKDEPEDIAFPKTSKDLKDLS